MKLRAQSHYIVLRLFGRATVLMEAEPQVLVAP